MFKVLVDGCRPERGSKYSACVDLFASEDVTIGAGETKLVGLGIAIGNIDAFIEADMRLRYGLLGLQDETDAYIDAFKKSHYLQLMLRSSLGKKGLILPNGVGIIDLDYKDEIKMIIHNPVSSIFVAHLPAIEAGTMFDIREGFQLKSSGGFVIKKGDKIGQITLLEHHGYMFGIDTEDERDGGFGSTGA